MILPDLLNELERLDVKLQASDEGDLDLDCPESVVLTDEVVGALKEHKAALLARLAGFEQAPNLAVPSDHRWRETVGSWPIEARQRWADMAEERQVAGDPWDLAEWTAFLTVNGAIAAANAHGDNVAVVGPPKRLSDADAIARIDALAWTGESLTDLIELGQGLNAEARRA